MKHLIILVFLLTCFSLKAQNIPISDSLMYRMSVSEGENYEENEKLLSLLSKEISNYSKKENDIGGGANVLYVLYANLDRDEDIELIAFTGVAWKSDYFVFDRIDDKWFLIHKGINNLANGQGWHYGVSPIKDTPLIWIKYYDGGGTGLHVDRYFFYKLIGNDFKKVLMLAGRHSLSEGLLYLDFDLNTKFYTHSSGGIDAIIDSKFYLRYYEEGDNEVKYMTLFERDITISFEWNESKEEYFPVFSEENNLSKEQQEFLLLQKENQNLFYQLFKSEIEEVRRDLSKEDIKILDKWIEYVEKSIASKK